MRKLIRKILNPRSDEDLDRILNMIEEVRKEIEEYKVKLNTPNLTLVDRQLLDIQLKVRYGLLETYLDMYEKWFED